MTVTPLVEEKSPPNYLYKYRSLQKERAWKHTLDIIEHNRIYFANIRDFNDPFDCLPKMEMANTYRPIKEIVKHNYPEMPRHERRYKEAELKRQFSRGGHGLVDLASGDSIYPDHGVGVLCLANKANNFLMWSHYADSHRGVCLRFKTEYGIFEHAREVIYSNERPVIGSYTHSPDEAVRAALLTKADFWAYEEEWRVLSHPGALEGLPPGPGIANLPLGLLDAVIMGVNISNQDKDYIIKIINILNNGRNNSYINIFSTTLDKNYYKVNIEGVF